MDFLKTMIKFKWPILLPEFLLLLAGIMIVIGGFKIKKKSNASSLAMIIMGFLIVIASSYLLIWTLFIGYNS
ncbi:MAG: hypothetical protein L0J63_11035 [Tetragenococcus koreensis]|nr:hypothetical protein [Tetragenococcus koreensis]MDN6317693.1 hypothetical protein [Lactococcus lactis]